MISDSTIVRKIQRLSDADLREQLAEVEDTHLTAWFGNDGEAEAESRQEFDLLLREWQRRQSRAPGVT